MRAEMLNRKWEDGQNFSDMKLGLEVGKAREGM
jgi:hypothetical protein